MKTIIRKRLNAIGMLVLITGLALPARATLLVQYTFDEASSGTTSAINYGTAASANGVFFGSATRTSNTPGNHPLGALNLNPDGGNNDFVGTATDLDALDQLGAMTLTTWINVQGTRGLAFYALGSDVQNNGLNGWEWYYNPVGGDAAALQLVLGVSNATVYKEGVATANVGASNTWVFLAATWDGSTVTFYSGTPTSAVTQLGTSLSLANTMGNNANNMRVGAQPLSANDRTPNAFMDDFRLYNNVLNLSALEDIRFSDVIPEPSTLMLFVIGGGCLWFRRRRR